MIPLASIVALEVAIAIRTIMMIPARQMVEPAKHIAPLTALTVAFLFQKATLI
jgi:hypothetical protein